MMMNTEVEKKFTDGETGGGSTVISMVIFSLFYRVSTAQTVKVFQVQVHLYWVQKKKELVNV
jgi:hypothetical protein